TLFPYTTLFRSHVLRERGGEARPHDAAERRARGDEAEQALSLLGVEEVDHQRPENRDDEEIENRRPHEKDAAYPDRLLGARASEKQEEENEIRHEKSIRDGDEAIARQLRDERGERRVYRQHAEQRRGKKPGKIFDPACDADLIADRPDNVIGRKDGEDIDPRPRERRDLLRPSVDDAAEKTISRATAGIGRLRVRIHPQ